MTGSPSSLAPANVRIIGLVGGVASGKSLVAQQLCQLGAHSFDADRVAHDVLRLPEVEVLVRERWGTRVFGADGHVDRAALGGIVFEPSPRGPVELKYLEQLTHPKIGQAFARQLAELSTLAGTHVLVIDAPLMLEAGMDKWCEKIIFVEAPRPMRLARALARGWREVDFVARERAQDSLPSKRQRADVVIDNSGSPDATRAQVERLWQSLVGV